MQLGWFLRLPSLHVLVFLLKTFCDLFVILSIATVPIMNAVKNGKLDGNDTTALSHHPYILCHFAVTYCGDILSKPKIAHWTKSLWF